MAVTTGTTIATVYYAQPILTQIGASFGTTAAAVGNLPALTQAGVGLGILFLAPLGDMLDRKRIAVVLEILLSLALLAMALSPNIAAASAASFAIGVFAVAVQIVVPMAAALSAPEERGRIVGIVFTGTLIGILGSRIVSGLVAEWIRWRAVYGGAAAVAIVIAFIVAATLPAQPGSHRDRYPALLGSTARQFIRFPALRRLSLLGGLIFGAFCCFWTTLTFQLSGPTFGYGSDRIGLFGFAAVSGALAAPWFGGRADRTSPPRAQLLTTGILVLGVVVVTLFPASALALVVATFVIDVGVQGTQVNNLAQLYGLDASAHSRINTAFMTIFFLGGAAGTASGVVAWRMGGWTFVSLLLLAWSLAALAVSLLHHRRSRETAASQECPPVSVTRCEGKRKSRDRVKR